MGRLKTAAPRLRTAESRVKPASKPVGNYGQGRGGRPWRRLRLQVFLRDLYTCCACGGTFPPGRLACDHIVPQSKGGSDDMGNLQTLCAGTGTPDCHGRKTIEEMGGKPRRAIGVDGWPIPPRGGRDRG